MEENWKDGRRDRALTFWYKNGQKTREGKYKNGKKYGLWVWWHENGNKQREGDYKDNKEIKGSRKYWNSKVQPVDSYKEAVAE
jgi:antitoxin component YwqK of YwqJK toxin-antitoxin module